MVNFPSGNIKEYYMAYAVIKTGGKQYRVSVGDKIDVEKISQTIGTELTFEALLLHNNDNLTIGNPVIAGSKIVTKVVEQFRDKKGIAFKFKRRKGFHKTKGFRRHLTKLEVLDITL